MVLSVAYSSQDGGYSSFFSQLDDKLRNSLHAEGEVTEHARGDTIIAAGEVSGRLYVMLEGIAKVTRCEHKKHLTLAVLRPGDMFGELSMINGQPTTADIVAMEDCEVLSVGRKTVYKLLQNSPEFMCLFLETLSHRTRQVIENVCAMALEDVYGRLKRTLTMLADKNGAKRQIEGVTHAELAEMVGASREMVSIILKELKMGDYIRVDGRVITLLKEFPDKR